MSSANVREEGPAERSEDAAADGTEESVWPSAEDGPRAAQPAQVFRPEQHAAEGTTEDAAETAGEAADAPDEVADGADRGGADAGPGAPDHDVLVAGERAWDDGLIARRAPEETLRAPAVPAVPGAPGAPVVPGGPEAAGPGAAEGAGGLGTDSRRPEHSGKSTSTSTNPSTNPTPSPAQGEHRQAAACCGGRDGCGCGSARGTAAVRDDARSADGATGPDAPDAPEALGSPEEPHRPGAAPAPEAERVIGGGVLRQRLGALRELIGLSRTRLEGKVLAEAGRVLDEAGARGRLSRAYTTVAIAGATGSGKSSLFNAFAGRDLSEVGTARPTTAEPVACTWEAEREGGADGLLDRLGIAPRVRRRVRDAELHGLVLIDLPDHDSVAEGHREQVDRLLGLVDAVVWVVDPEKYADAPLHERYLRPLAGHAEVTFVVLNQIDRLPGDAADVVLDDLRRLLDEDGVALGEHGEPGARVLATSALTGAGVRDFRAELGAFVAAREAAVRRLTADLDGATERLRPVYADPVTSGPVGLTEPTREEFEDRLASAVGAAAAGRAAERAWLRHAERSCGTPWSQLVRWRDARRQANARHRASPESGTPRPQPARMDLPLEPGGRAWDDTEADGPEADGPEADGPETAAGQTPNGTPGAAGAAEPGPAGVRVARPVLAQAVRELADRAVTGLPDAWRKTVRDAAWRGAEGLPEVLDAVVGEARRPAAERQLPARMVRPPWWTAATAAQGLLLALQVLGVFWLIGAVLGTYRGASWLPAALLLGGAVGGPLLAWACRTAARGPARAYGQEEERRLRRLAAGCGRARVLEPVAAELLRYREVREQYVIASGEADRL